MFLIGGLPIMLCAAILDLKTASIAAPFVAIFAVLVYFLCSAKGPGATRHIRRNVTIAYVLFLLGAYPYILLLTKLPPGWGLDLSGSVTGPLDLVALWMYLLVCALWTHAAVAIAFLEQSSKAQPEIEKMSSSV